MTDRVTERVNECVSDGLTALQARLQHQFSNPALLGRAITHRSFSADHNERLEFLGDGVLNLVVADFLYAQLSDLPEGDLPASAPTWSSKTPCTICRLNSVCPM